MICTTYDTPMALPLSRNLLLQNWEVMVPIIMGTMVISEKVAMGVSLPTTYLNQ